VNKLTNLLTLQSCQNPRTTNFLQREVVRALHRHRANDPYEEGPRCAGVHQSVSLKHNHLFNDLAHLRTLAILLDKQRDLFGF
jgi:hypothetical protein